MTCRIDCALHHYIFLASGAVEAKEKTAAPQRATEGTIQGLFLLTKKDLEIERAYDLSQFTQALSFHLERSIKRRYSILSWFVLFLSKNWGALKQLRDLKNIFDHSVAAKKEALILQPPTAKILASIFYVDPEFSTHDPAINSCYKQLHQPGLFPAHETIQLAWFLTKTPLTETRYKKNPALDLPRSFHRDPATGTIFIRNKAAQIAQTNVKTVAKALLYNQNKTQKTRIILDSAVQDAKAIQDLESESLLVGAEHSQEVKAAHDESDYGSRGCVDLASSTAESRIIAQLTTRKELSESMRKRTFNEYTTYKKYQECPGLWPMLHATEYDSKVALFTELGKGDFEKLGSTLPFLELVKRTRQLLEGLAWFHSRDLLHIDVKGANALLGDTEKTGWIDLSFAGSLSDPKIIERLKTGHYGTRCFTAPELFGVEGFRSRQKEAEMWAFGVMLYRARFKEYPQWFSRKFTDKENEITPTLKVEYKAAISDEILPRLEALHKKPSLNQEERFECTIYKLLHPDPTLRLTAEGALNELREIITFVEDPF